MLPREGFQVKKQARRRIFSATLISLLLLVLLLLTSWYLSDRYDSLLERVKRQHVYQDLSIYGNALSSALNERIALLVGLGAFVESDMFDAHSDSHFATFAAGLHSGGEGIRAIQVFPPEGLVNVYPLEGNEQVARRSLDDLINDERDDVRRDVRRAIETGQIVLSGPYELRQQGLGLVARMAVYRDGQFWGLAVIVFDLPPILSVAGIKSAPDNLRIVLRDADGRDVWGDAGALGGEPVTYVIKIPSQEWVLAAVPDGGWASRGAVFAFRSGGLLFAILISLIVYMMLSRNAHLAAVVAARTLELEQEKDVVLLNSRIANLFLTQSHEMLYGAIGATVADALGTSSACLSYADDQGNLICPSPDGQSPSATAMVVPIMHKGDLIGQLAVASKPGGYTPHDRYLLETVAVQLAAPLKALLDEERYKQSHAQLEEQYRQSQKMEAVGRLAGGVAHDFNNMLAVIIGHTEAALEDLPRSHPVYENLQDVEKAARRSAGLTRQLLAFARKQITLPKVIDLNETIDSMLKILQRLMGENIELIWSPASSVWPVKIDPGQIDQVLANLCVNARDAIEGQGKVVIASTNVSVDRMLSMQHPELNPGDYVKVTVSDTGCGISQELLPNIFEPFYTTKEVGTGLGLATLYGIVAQNGGVIQVESVLERGTTFVIYLPKFDGEAEEAPAVELSEVGGTETVLVTEDEPAMLEIATIMLRGLGYRVLQARLPSEALQLVKQHQVSLLITDVIMPEMNGRDLYGAVSQLAPAVKCLYMSGYTADIIAKEGVLEDGIGFIEKPFVKSELARAVRAALDG